MSNKPAARMITPPPAHVACFLHVESRVKEEARGYAVPQEAYGCDDVGRDAHFDHAPYEGIDDMVNDFL